jgi:hypothetical protein
VYDGVPIAVPARVASAVLACPSRIRATPKSSTFTAPSAQRKMVSVDDAHVMALREQVEHRVEDLQGALGREGAARRHARVVEGLAVEQLHHEEGLAAIARVVVDDGHARGVLDPVRDLALAEEPLADGRVVQQIGGEDLDGRPRAVPVRGREHARHAAYPEQVVEGPLGVERRADPCARRGLWIERGRVHRHGATEEYHTIMVGFDDVWRWPRG